MLNRVREAVSADRRRYKDSEFNLDLSYVTPRIIAMAIPSDGLMAAYRNHMDDVDAFLRREHGENFMIWNLSEFSYDAKFSDKVIHLPFPDHHPPPLDLFFKLVEMIDNWLRADDKHVAVVHCKGGKGRTGTVVVSLLIFRGECATVEEAELLFASMRSSKHRGVTQPSQRRYIQYFRSVLMRDRFINFQPIRLRSVTIAPLLSERPILLQIFNGVTDDAPLLFSQMRDPIPFSDATSMVKYTVELDVRGDLYFKVFRRRDKDKVERAFHVVLHSYFIGSTQYILERKDLDHLKSSDRRFSNELTMTFQFSTPQTARLFKNSDDLHERMSQKYLAHCASTNNGNTTPRKKDNYATMPPLSEPAVSALFTYSQVVAASTSQIKTVMEHPLVAPHVKLALQQSDSTSIPDAPSSELPSHPASSSVENASPSPNALKIRTTRGATHARDLDDEPPSDPAPKPPPSSKQTSNALDRVDSQGAVSHNKDEDAKLPAMPRPPSLPPARTLGQMRKSRREMASGAILKGIHELQSQLKRVDSSDDELGQSTPPFASKFQRATSSSNSQRNSIGSSGGADNESTSSNTLTSPPSFSMAAPMVMKKPNSTSGQSIPPRPSVGGWSSATAPFSLPRGSRVTLRNSTAVTANNNSVEDGDSNTGVISSLPNVATSPIQKNSLLNDEDDETRTSSSSDSSDSEEFYDAAEDFVASQTEETATSSTASATPPPIPVRPPGLHTLHSLNTSPSSSSPQQTQPPTSPGRAGNGTLRPNRAPPVPPKHR